MPLGHYSPVDHPKLWALRSQLKSWPTDSWQDDKWAPRKYSATSEFIHIFLSFSSHCSTLLFIPLVLYLSQRESILSFCSYCYHIERIKPCWSPFFVEANTLFLSAFEEWIWKLPASTGRRAPTWAPWIRGGSWSETRSWSNNPNLPMGPMGPMVAIALAHFKHIEIGNIWRLMETHTIWIHLDESWHGLLEVEGCPQGAMGVGFEFHPAGGKRLLDPTELWSWNLSRCSIQLLLKGQLEIWRRNSPAINGL